MFYDYDLGPAGFEAPVGWIEGELIRKRQFKIQQGIMEYAIESGTNVHDEILQKELAHVCIIRKGYFGMGRCISVSLLDGCI